MSARATHCAVEETAYLAAEARRLETERIDGLVNDPFATLFSTAESAVALEGLGGAQTVALVGLRTRWVDRAILSALGEGISGLVVLGSGFDVRPLRLPQLQDLPLVEVDLPGVLETKRSTLLKHGLNYPAHWIEGSCADDSTLRRIRRIVQDLTPQGNWLWLMEGLLGYLSSEEASRLFKAIPGVSPARCIFDLPRDTGDHCAHGLFTSPDPRIEDLASLEWDVSVDQFEAARVLWAGPRVDEGAPCAYFEATTRD